MTTPDLEAWAAEQAARLPPLTDDEAAEAGRIAAKLDAVPTTAEPDDQVAGRPDGGGDGP